MYLLMHFFLNPVTCNLGRCGGGGAIRMYTYYTYVWMGIYTMIFNLRSTLDKIKVAN